LHELGDGIERLGADVVGRRLQGFTLIELLIVIAIIGMLGALVAPFGSRAMEATRSQEEWLVLNRASRDLSFRAFAARTPILIDGRGNELVWTDAVGATRKLAFNQLFFPPQSIRIGSSGIAEPGVLRVVQRGRERQINFNEWINDE
jgi:prepilin-type N-terminal cleavage/methylation domain-containing protein